MFRKSLEQKVMFRFEPNRQATRGRPLLGIHQWHQGDPRAPARVAAVPGRGRSQASGHPAAHLRAGRQGAGRGGWRSEATTTRTSTGGTRSRHTKKNLYDEWPSATPRSRRWTRPTRTTAAADDLTPSEHHKRQVEATQCAEESKNQKCRHMRSMRGIAVASASGASRCTASWTASSSTRCRARCTTTRSTIGCSWARLWETFTALRSPRTRRLRRRASCRTPTSTPT